MTGVTTARVRFPGSFLIRLVVIAGLMLGLAAVGYLAARRPVEQVAVIVGGLLLILLYLKKPEIGIYALLLTALFVRFTLPTGTQSRIVASLLLTAVLAALWLARMLAGRKLSLRASPARAPLLAFMLVTVISYIWSSAVRDPLVVVWRSWPVVQLGALAVLLLLPTVFLLAANLLPDLRALEILTAILLAAGVLAALRALLPLPLAFMQVRPLFPTWFVCLAYSQALFNRRLPLWLRIMLLACICAYLYRIFSEQMVWLSAWLPTVLALLAISLWRSRVLLLVLLLVSAIYVGANLRGVRAAYSEENRVSGVTRIDAYIHNWRVTSQHLLFGTGPAGYAVYYMTYFPNEAMATHSNYLDVFAQTGIIGLLAFMAFYLALARTAHDSLVRVRKRFDFAHAFAVGAAGGLVGTVVATGLGDWILPFVYTQTIAGFDYALCTWLMLGAAQALGCILRREESAGAP